MALITQWGVATDTNILELVEMAMYQQAVIVFAEAGATQNHAARAAYAAKVLAGQVDFGRISRILLAQPSAAAVTKSPPPTDAATVGLIAALWDDLSTPAV